jgi:pyoverdine/dityrosine biosynthesis protein Dit1
MVDGIHRFLFEELVDLRPDFSRSHCRNLTRSSAYETVRRSDAWSKLLADIFPYSLRLSIHPQSAHSQKIGILLGSCDDIWLTPWHAVAVKMGEQWKLMKAKKAVETGAGLVYRDGRPSYFESQSLD